MSEKNSVTKQDRQTPQEKQDVIAFLRTKTDNPPPLPEVTEEKPAGEEKPGGDQGSDDWRTWSGRSVQP